jgi:N-acetylglucosamine kinase-like BadF-type ATPase
MRLIADSGATKTDWVIIQADNELRSAQTIGFNPYFIGSEGILEELEKNLYPFLDNDKVKEVFFYGAGCSTPKNCDIVSTALEDFFGNADIFVEHDLLGAARALCGHHEGIACILGTGSNSCYFDGKEIRENVASLGFVLADEGSGAYMGKHLIRDFFLGEMPSEISAKFENNYQLTLEKVLDAVYNRPHPNRYLASFTFFLSENIKEPYINDIVKSAFRDFFRFQVTKYSNYKTIPLSAVGSIVFHFMEIFKDIAAENGLTTKKIIQTPIEGLVHYHL